MFSFLIGYIFILQLAILVLDPWIQENIHLLVAKSLSRK